MKSGDLMKRDTKKVILQTAYLLFSEKGYDAVSVSMIQEAADIGRATMYHYFKSKQELFEVVMEMTFEVAKAEEQHSDVDEMLLSTYIAQRIEKAKKSIENSPLPKNIGMLNYFILNFQALELNPDLAEQGYEIHQLEINRWEKIIRNSVKQGEILKQTDVEKTARLFMNVRHGVGATSTFKTSMEASVNKIDEMYKYIFSLIRS
jgi:AcrR family transcriptional regulator